MSLMQMDSLLSLPTAELVSIADKTRRELVPPKLELCGIINAKSGLCSEDCKFCAQSSRHKAEISTYSLKDKAEIVRAAQIAKETGAERLGIVTSGNRLTEQELDVLAQATQEINDKVGIAVCGSLGALTKNELGILKDAGLSRYHHNIETSPRFYSQIVSTHSFQQRIDTIDSAKAVGMEVCSGGIIGMGETWQDRIAMANVLNELDVDSVPINFLIPIQGTAMASLETISCNDAIRTIALFRIILGHKTIRLAAGRESVLKDFQGMAFMAGANGMMIGGYLTVGGRLVEEDHRLVKEINSLWTE